CGNSLLSPKKFPKKKVPPLFCPGPIVICISTRSRQTMKTPNTQWMDERIEELAEILADKLIEEIRKRALEKRTNQKSEAA
ncbi:hypothetical protein, partial [Leptospira gomenensis]|uniref:hypothetical protein n=1 Tax=Leptospira gomenensis TaxID=2484974 RepID=UPI001AF01853